jgi:hypothetical protein
MLDLTIIVELAIYHGYPKKPLALLMKYMIICVKVEMNPSNNLSG